MQHFKSITKETSTSRGESRALPCVLSSGSNGTAAIIARQDRFYSLRTAKDPAVSQVLNAGHFTKLGSRKMHGLLPPKYFN